MSYAFLDPFVCVGATPVYVMRLLILLDVFIIFLGLAFGGWMPGSKEAQLFNWNALEAMAAFAWLGLCLATKCHRLHLTQGHAWLLLRQRTVRVKVELDVAVVLGVVCYLNHAVRGFAGLAYVKDRLYTLPLTIYKDAISTRRKNNLDEDVLAERERVLALFEDGEKEEEDVVELTVAEAKMGFPSSMRRCKRRVAGRII